MKISFQQSTFKTWCTHLIYFHFHISSPSLMDMDPLALNIHIQCAKKFSI